MNAKTIIEELKAEGFDAQQIKEFLEDGAALAEKGISDQEVVEEAHALIQEEITV